MNHLPCPAVVALGLALTASAIQPSAPEERETYLAWSASQAESIGKSTYRKGRVKGGWRGLHTERAINYELAATWITPDVIRATARLEMIRSGLSEDNARALVVEAQAAGDTVILVELDPNEGSGVIPKEWQAFLLPRGLEAGGPGTVRGTNAPELRKLPTMRGVRRRDYDFDQFWVVFPLRTADGEPVFPDFVAEAELVVRIYNQQGRVHWRIPDSVRQRQAALARH